MKLSIDDHEARTLAARLRDEQPGSPLLAVRRQLDEKLNPKAGQPLSGEELDQVLLAVLDREEFLAKFGNPTAGQTSSLAAVTRALPKLELMRDRQRARESQ